MTHYVYYTPLRSTKKDIEKANIETLSESQGIEKHVRGMFAIFKQGRDMWNSKYDKDCFHDIVSYLAVADDNRDSLRIFKENKKWKPEEVWERYSKEKKPYITSSSPVDKNLNIPLDICAKDVFSYNDIKEFKKEKFKKLPLIAYLFKQDFEVFKEIKPFSQELSSQVFREQYKESVLNEYPIKEKNEIILSKDPSAEMAKVCLNGTDIFSGNYWDFHAGCYRDTLSTFLDDKYGEFRRPESFVNKLSKFIEDEGKKVTIKEKQDNL